MGDLKKNLAAKAYVAPALAMKAMYSFLQVHPFIFVAMIVLTELHPQSG
jgi:hypothetical protein